MNTNIYRIKVITNLHAGSGDAGYGIVDKLVQRDATSNIPAIYASGIKGAIREFFDKHLRKTYLAEVFGDEGNASTGSRAGQYRFLSADLLAIPAPQEQTPYYQLICDSTHIAGLQQKYQKLDSGFSIGIQGYTNNAVGFKEACSDLPVIARNHLENGQSKNLWYEEVVPHQSEFIMAIQFPENDTNITDFNTSLNGNVIQVGGNATVGYGLCSFSKIN
ncbi:MAG: RAMP superfamily CRISPR-associated protein [Bacteroidota bacterium]|nr:RAMP superfamily CRISPR-associated protein [Bacteroidota bacterium]